MGLPAETSSDCRARAAYARDRADRCRSRMDKAAWLRIAREWEQLAATFDDEETMRLGRGGRAAAPKAAVIRPRANRK